MRNTTPLMDIDYGTSWEDLVGMAQDRDAWKLRVVGLKIASKAEPWKEATAAKKALRKELRSVGSKPPPPAQQQF